MGSDVEEIRRMAAGQIKTNPINLDHILESYDDFLAGTARGVDYSAEFLGIWAPGSDVIESLYNMAVAAVDWGEPQLAVSVSAAALADTDRVELEGILSRFGTLSVDEEPERICFVIENLAPEGKEASSVDPAYVESITRYAEIQRHDHLPVPASQQKSLVVEDGEVRFGITLNGMSDRILEAGYERAGGTVEKGILEAFASLIEGSPLQDASEYGVIRLEAKLRGVEAPRPVPGIVIAAAAEPAFELPQRLIRKIFADHMQQRSGDRDTNFYSTPPGEEWRDKSDEERTAVLKDAISDYLEDGPYAGHKLAVLEIQGGFRVTCQYSQDVPHGIKGELLLNLEKHLRQEVEPTIELFLVGLEDANVIRQPGAR